MKKSRIFFVLLLCLLAMKGRSQIDTIAGYFITCETGSLVVRNATLGGTWRCISDNTPHKKSFVFSSAGDSAVINGYKPGKDTIIYKVGSDSVMVTLTINPVPTISYDLHFCVGDSLTLTTDSAYGIWATTVTTVAGIVTVNPVTASIFSTCTNDTSCHGGTQVTYTRPYYYQCPNNSARTGTIFVIAPDAIEGPHELCVGSSADFSIESEYGHWTSSDPSIATVTGIGDKEQHATVTGISAGTVTISYSQDSGCIVTHTITVNPVPAITGTLSVCVGTTTTLNGTPSGGIWTSSNPSIATIGSSSGIVTGIVTGSVNITYTSGGCSSVVTLSVTALPADITGTLTVCVGQTTSLSSSPSGGTWTSSNGSVATVNASTGIVTGITAGTAVITYALSTGCWKMATVTVNAVPANITGTLSLYCSQSTTLSCSTSGGTWSSSNTAVGTVNSSGVVAAISPGVTNISYTLSTGCYKVVTVTVNAPVINGTPAMCVGSSVSLSITGPSGGTWTSGNTAIATVGSSTGIVYGVAAGNAGITYTKTATCYATKTATVGAIFSVSICELEPIATCDAAISYCSGLKLSVSGGDSTAYYSWTPSIPATKTMSGSDAVYSFTAAPTSGTYTVTVTKNGCSAKKTVEIWVADAGCYPCDHFKPCYTGCTGCDTILPFKTVAGSTITSSEMSSATPGFYYIPKRTATTVTTLNVSPASGSVILVGADVTLKIYNSIVLDSVHIFSSPSCPWSGISVANNSSPAKLSVTGNSLIENAAVAAIEVTGASTAYKPSSGYVIESDNAIFNLNKIGIRIYPFVLGTTDTTYPFSVRSTVFTNRDFCDSTATWSGSYPFSWPTSAHLRTPKTTESGYNPSFNVDDYPAYHHADYTGISITSAGYTDSLAGYEYFYRGITIGDSGTAGNTNLFDTLGVGVAVANANVRLYNNIFRRTPFFNPVNGLPYASTAGVSGSLSYTDFVGKKRSIELLYGSSEHTNNRFYNCHHGFLGNCWYTFISKGSEMYSTVITYGGDVSDMNYGIRNTASATNRYFGKHIIEHNKFGNLRRSIFEYLESCYNPNSAVKITGNEISDTIAYTNSENGGFGIDMGERGSCSSVGASLLIDSNTVTGPLLGIYYHGDNSPLLYASFNSSVKNNTVVLRNDLGTTMLTRKGIICYYAKYISDISHNHVYGDTLHGVDYNTPSPSTVPAHDAHAGIELQRVSNTTTTNADVSCNYVHDIATGFRFVENSAVNWHNNVMLRNTYGMTLMYGNSVGGSIGTQGDTCHPSDNVWYDDAAGATGWPGWLGSNVYETYSVSSDPAYSMLYVRDITAAPARYKPVNNSRKLYTTPAGIAYALGTTILDTSSLCSVETSYTCAAGLYEVSEGGGGEGQSKNPGKEKLNDLASGYTLYPNPGDGSFIIRQTLAHDEISAIRIFNYAGQVVYGRTIEFGNGIATVDMGNIAKGIYLVVITDARGSTNTLRVVVR